MNAHTMLPKKYTVVFYNHEGEINFEATQVTFLTVEQLKEQTAIILEDTGRAKDISKVEVIEI
ncbi:hypothetical protein [Bacillus cereus]|uniref:hypothetical protein n=1 Tax=Bacillus cereus TaxID=1396 RepID=UPI000BFAEC68|nr:hypothetical protein [Bacillus cereus]PFD41445.1 hypothetical protein CN281_27065 [Bacillus cereus]